MGSDTVETILRQPGRLCITPTSLAITGAFPWGGTSLGMTRDGMELSLPMGLTPLRGMDRAGAFDWLWVGGEPMITCELYQWDDDVLATLFPTTFSSSGSVAAKRLLAYPGPGRGVLMSAYAVKLLFSPLDTRRGKCVYFPAAVPALEETARLVLRRKDPMVMPVVFRAGYDTTKASDKQQVVMGDLRDIGL